MSRMPSLAACVAVLALASCAAAAFAAERIVWPAYILLSSNRINLTGCSSTAIVPGQAADSLDYLARLTVTTLDFYQNPIAGIPVVIDFSGCPDIRIASTQSYHQTTAQCATSTVQGYTSYNGRVSFVVVGGIVNGSDHAPGCARVYADSYDGGSIGVGAYDLDGSGSMTLADIARVWTDYNSAVLHDRSDFDGNGYVTLADIAYAWAAISHPFDRFGSSLCP